MIDRRLTLAAVGAAALAGTWASRLAAAETPALFVLLHSPGPAWNPALGFRQQPGVMDHVRYMASFEADGALVLGGPFLDNSGGMMILRAPSLEAARALAEADPAVKAGLLRVTVKPWLVAMGAQAKTVQTPP
jgi:uncharacterized protein YciI